MGECLINYREPFDQFILPNENILQKAERFNQFKTPEEFLQSDIIVRNGNPIPNYSHFHNAFGTIF